MTGKKEATLLLLTLTDSRKHSRNKTEATELVFPGGESHKLLGKNKIVDLMINQSCQTKAALFI